MATEEVVTWHLVLHDFSCNSFFLKFVPKKERDTWCYITNHKDRSNLHNTPISMWHDIRCLLHWYLVSYVILCHYDNFLDDTFYKYVNKYYHGWCTSSSIGQNPTSSCQQLVIKYHHEWLKFRWKSFCKWHQLQHYKSIPPPK